MTDLRAALKLDYREIGQFYQGLSTQAFIHDLVELTEEMYRSLEAGCRRAPIILAGEGLFRVNCELILHITLQRGRFSFRKHGIDTVFLREEVTKRAVAQKLLLVETMEALYQNKVLDSVTKDRMDFLRHLRNKAVHGDLPGLLSQDSPSTVQSLAEVEAIMTGQQPLPQRSYFLFMEVHGKEEKYIIDQAALDINLDAVERYQMRLPIIATKTFLLCVRSIATQFV